MSKAKLDWTLFEKAAAAVKQSADLKRFGGTQERDPSRQQPKYIKDLVRPGRGPGTGDWVADDTSQDPGPKQEGLGEDALRMLRQSIEGGRRGEGRDEQNFNIGELYVKDDQGPTSPSRTAWERAVAEARKTNRSTSNFQDFADPFRNSSWMDGMATPQQPPLRMLNPRQPLPPGHPGSLNFGK
jgi:hypothetical protein